MEFKKGDRVSVTGEYDYKTFYNHYGTIIGIYDQSVL